MKTKITQEIDGYKIIVGIGEAQIDPVATAPIMIEALKLSDEYKSVDKLKSEISVLIHAAAQALRNAKTAKTKSEIDKFSNEYQKRQDEIKVVEENIKPLLPTLMEKQHELILKHAVYFQPTKGEYIISDDVANKIDGSLRDAAVNGYFLDDNFMDICDNRGLVIFKKSSGKWSNRTITKIGDKPGTDEIPSDQMTEIQRSEYLNQIEAERILKLTTSEKLSEKNKKISELLNQSITMRLGLEIKGDSEALKKSQDWYNTEILKVEELYK